MSLLEAMPDAGGGHLLNSLHLQAWVTPFVVTAIQETLIWAMRIWAMRIWAMRIRAMRIWATRIGTCEVCDCDLGPLCGAKTGLVAGTGRNGTVLVFWSGHDHHVGHVGFPRCPSQFALRHAMISCDEVCS